MATAVQVESIWNGLTDNSGQPLAAGKVYTYSAGTTTPVSLYTSSDKSTSATNPLILDGNGKAQVWADGRYKFVVKTAADVTLYTLDNLLYGFDDTTVLLGGISTGSANTQVVSVPATVESYANGQRITFIAGYTNSGATTLQFNSLAPISIVKGPLSSSLQHGDLIAGQLYSCTYYGGSFRLENVPTPADVQRSRAQLVTGLTGTNTLAGGVTSPALTAYEVGSVFRFKSPSTNNNAVTINISALGPQTIQYNGIALTGGEIQANQYYELVYDGTQFQLLNPTLVADVYATGVAGSDTITATVPAVAGAYTTGMKVWFQAAASNTGATTINLNGLGAKAVQLNGAALAGGEIVSGRWVELVYDGTQFQLLNPAMSASTRTLPASVGQVQDGDYIWLGTTGGTATAQTASAAPAITAYKAGQKFRMIVGTGLGSTGASTTAHTININSLGAKNIVNNEDSTNPTLGTWVEGAIMELVYDGTNFRITNSPTGWLDLTPTVTADTGTIGTVTGTYKYRKAGRVVYLHSVLDFTHSGTVTAFLLINHPVTPLASAGQSVHAQLATPASSGVVIPCSFYTTTTSGGRFAIRLASLGTITGVCRLSISGYYAAV